STLFEVRWQNLLQKFSLAANYLNRVLYPSHHAWACAFTSKIFTAGVQTTSHIEGYNSIIKRVLHSNSSLCDLVKTLDERLEKEAEWNHFFKYQTLTNCIGIISVGSEMFSVISHVMMEYLTPHILSVEYVEMAQCLYFNAIRTGVEIVDSYNKDENVGDKFIEDIYNARQILLNSMVMEVDQTNIKEIWQLMDKRPGNNKQKHFVVITDSVLLVSKVAGFHIRIIASRWYCDNKKETIDQSKVIFINEHAIQIQQNQPTLIIPQPNVVPHSVATTTQLAVECYDNKMAQWLRTFINQKKQFLENKRSSDEVNESEKEDSTTIANPPVIKHRERPETKRYKSAIENAQRQLYTCRTCSK
ncbi:2863_t:CDS:2, partial [Dentiscutata heterogama]